MSKYPDKVYFYYTPTEVSYSVVSPNRFMGECQSLIGPAVYSDELLMTSVGTQYNLFWPGSVSDPTYLSDTAIQKIISDQSGFRIWYFIYNSLTKQYSTSDLGTVDMTSRFMTLYNQCILSLDTQFTLPNQTDSGNSKYIKYTLTMTVQSTNTPPPPPVIITDNDVRMLIDAEVVEDLERVVEGQGKRKGQSFDPFEGIVEDVMNAKQKIPFKDLLDKLDGKNPYDQLIELGKSHAINLVDPNGTIREAYNDFQNMQSTGNPLNVLTKYTNAKEYVDAHINSLRDSYNEYINSFGLPQVAQDKLINLASSDSGWSGFFQDPSKFITDKIQEATDIKNYTTNPDGFIGDIIREKQPVIVERMYEAGAMLLPEGVTTKDMMSMMPADMTQQQVMDYIRDVYGGQKSYVQFKNDVSAGAEKIVTDKVGQILDKLGFQEEFFSTKDKQKLTNSFMNELKNVKIFRDPSDKQKYMESSGQEFPFSTSTHPVNDYIVGTDVQVQIIGELFNSLMQSGSANANHMTNVYDELVNQLDNEGGKFLGKGTSLGYDNPDGRDEWIDGLTKAWDKSKGPLLKHGLNGALGTAAYYADVGALMNLLPTIGKAGVTIGGSVTLPAFLASVVATYGLYKGYQYMQPTVVVDQQQTQTQTQNPATETITVDQRQEKLTIDFVKAYLDPETPYDQSLKDLIDTYLEKNKIYDARQLLATPEQRERQRLDIVHDYSDRIKTLAHKVAQDQDRNAHNSAYDFGIFNNGIEPVNENHLSQFPTNTTAQTATNVHTDLNDFHYAQQQFGLDDGYFRYAERMSLQQAEGLHFRNMLGDAAQSVATRASNIDPLNDFAYPMVDLTGRALQYGYQYAPASDQLSNGASYIYDTLGQIGGGIGQIGGGIGQIGSGIYNGLSQVEQQINKLGTAETRRQALADTIMQPINAVTDAIGTASNTLFDYLKYQITPQPSQNQALPYQYPLTQAEHLYENPIPLQPDEFQYDPIPESVPIRTKGEGDEDQEEERLIKNEEESQLNKEESQLNKEFVYEPGFWSQTRDPEAVQDFRGFNQWQQQYEPLPAPPVLRLKPLPLDQEAIRQFRGFTPWQQQYDPVPPILKLDPPPLKPQGLGLRLKRALKQKLKKKQRHGRPEPKPSIKKPTPVQKKKTKQRSRTHTNTQTTTKPPQFKPDGLKPDEIKICSFQRKKVNGRWKKVRVCKIYKV